MERLIAAAKATVGCVAVWVTYAAMTDASTSLLRMAPLSGDVYAMAACATLCACAAVTAVATGRGKDLARLGLPLGLAAPVALLPMTWIFGRFLASAIIAGRAVSDGSLGIVTLLTAVAMALTAGFAEETVNRLAMIETARLWVVGNGPRAVRTRVALTSVLFALAHFRNLRAGMGVAGCATQAMAAFGAGAFFGAVYEVTGSVWPGVAAHAAFDLAGFLYDAMDAAAAAAETGGAAEPLANVVADGMSGVDPKTVAVNAAFAVAMTAFAIVATRKGATAAIEEGRALEGPEAGMEDDGK